MYLTLEYIKRQVSDICERDAVKSLFLVGSAARNELEESSDIDFLYAFKEEGIPDHLYADHFFSFKNALQKTLKAKIDLVAGDYLRNPYFIKSINKDKVLIYEA